MEFSDKEMGLLLGVTGRRVWQMAAEGKIPKPINGKYDGPAVVRALLLAAKQKRAESPSDKAIARARAAQAEAQEIRNAHARKELVAVDEVVNVFDTLVAAVRDEITALPARVTRDMDLRRKLEADIDGVLSRIAGRCGDAEDAVRSGEGVPDAASEDDA
jgi:phage terminase Nu1 subunit (DNA packaging protein)